MAKKTTLAEQIAEMEKAKNELDFYRKIFDKACVHTFNMCSAALKKSIQKNSEMTRFEAAIRKFFNIKSDEEMNDFLRFICTEKTKNYYQKSAEKAPADKQG